MGWAKYYEDNVSICIGRMVLREGVSVRNTPERNTPVGNIRVVEYKREIPIQPIEEHKADKVKQPMGNGRRGLELYFVSIPEVSVCRKLQLNGWWWSAAKQCWCNINNKVNRKYAKDITRKYRAQITVVAA